MVESVSDVSVSAYGVRLCELLVVPPGPPGLPCISRGQHPTLRTEKSDDDEQAFDNVGILDFGTACPVDGRGSSTTTNSNNRMTLRAVYELPYDQTVEMGGTDGTSESLNY